MTLFKPPLRLLQNLLSGWMSVLLVCNIWHGHRDLNQAERDADEFLTHHDTQNFADANGRRGMKEEAAQLARTRPHENIDTFLRDLSGSGNETYACEHDALHPFRNQLRPQQHPSEMPHTFHINSKTKCVTDHIQNYILNWRLPNYSIYLHDDQEMNNLFNMETVKETFPSLENAARCLPYQGVSSSASKNDLFRYLLLYYTGGIYTEFDLMPNPRGGFPNAIEQFESYFASEEAVEGAGMLLLKQNGEPFLGTVFFTPKHPLLYICVALVIQNLLQLRDVSRQRVLQLAGPPVLHEALQIFSGMNKGVDEGWKEGTYALSDGARKRYPHLATHHAGKYTIHIPDHESYYDYVYVADKEMRSRKQTYYKLAGLKNWLAQGQCRLINGIKTCEEVHEFNGSCTAYLNR